MGNWREAGFVLLHLDQHTTESLDSVFAASQSFFAHPHAEKQQCSDPNLVYFGYQQRVEFDKELFQVRFRCKCDHNII